jgi:hypothetical protein
MRGEHKQEGHHRRGERHKGKEAGSHPRGAKTFRRGRAIAFLEMMNLKRTTIKKQLEEPEFHSIQQILIGELKAIDMVINEFVQVFEIHESEMMEQTFVKREENVASDLDQEDSIEVEGENDKK